MNRYLVYESLTYVKRPIVKRSWYLWNGYLIFILFIGQEGFRGAVQKMTCDKEIPGIYLIVEFDWPATGDTEPEHIQAAVELHDVVGEAQWIQEIFTASEGIGGSLSAMWVFWLPDYSSLDRLLKEKNNRVSNAYDDFFSKMPQTRTKIRQEVIFS